jgi:hypothetical protein
MPYEFTAPTRSPVSACLHPLIVALRALRPRTGASSLRPAVALTGLAALGGHAGEAPIFPPTFDVELLEAENGGDGTLGFVVNGLERDGHLWNGNGAGDVDGDGVGDLIIGAPAATVVDGEPGAGQAFIVFGRVSYPAEIDVEDLLAAQGGDGTEGFVVNGRYGGYYSTTNAGADVNTAGDVDADGFDDLLVGAPGWDYRGAGAGEGYLVFGHGRPFPPELELGDPAAGIVVACGEDAGDGVTPIGDFNGDGLDDFAVGGPDRRAYYSDDAPGRTGVVFGSPDLAPGDFDCRDLRDGDGSGGIVMYGIDRDADDGGDEYDGGDDSGKSLGGGGDVNGDGLDDLVIGAPGGDPRGLRDAGQAYLVFGRADWDGGELDLESLLPENGGDGSMGVILEGSEERDGAGSDVAMLGDVDGDGLADVAVGSGSGAYVVFGRSSAFPPVIDLSTLLPGNGGDGRLGFVLGAVDAVAGGSLSAAGDINRDGLADMMIPVSTAGPAVVYGREEPFPAFFDLLSLLPENGGTGEEGFVLSCCGVGRAGDVNGDGIDDLIVGTGSGDERGITYVVFGRDTPLLDADLDGVTDDEDNCTLAHNRDQRDTDADGFGNRCDADFDGDCIVNFHDLAVMKVAFGTRWPEGDLDANGIVNFADLGILKSGFLEPPGPSGRADACDE